MAKITYANKEFINENASIPAINKVQDTDLNEIKTVVNGLVSDTYSTDTEQSYSCNYINSRISTLYTNNSGSNTDITLNDSVSNYSYLEVFGFEIINNTQVYSKIDLSLSKDLNLFAGSIQQNGNLFRFTASSYSISGNTMTKKTANTGHVNIFTRSINEQNGNGDIKITKVLGIK